MSDSVDQTAAAARISLHELRLINIGLHCIKGKAGTDIDKFTKMAGYKSNSVTSTAWSRVKRHLQKVVPVVEPEESDDVEESKDVVKKRKRAAKRVDEDSGDEAGPSKKQARGKKVQKDVSGEMVNEPNTKKAQKDESGDEMANEPNTKKTRVKKVAKADDTDEDGAVENTASQSAVKSGATPDDEPVTLECITVKGSGDDAGPFIKKGGQKGSKTVKKGVAAKGKGKVVQGSDASDDDTNNGKNKDAAKAGKSKGPATRKGTRQTTTGKNAQGKASKKAKEEGKNDSDAA